MKNKRRSRKFCEAKRFCGSIRSVLTPLVFSIICVLSATAAFGQDPESELAETPAASTEASSSTRLQEIVVTSQPLPQTLFESAQAVSVLEGAELQERAKTSLGETLAAEPGISSTSFGPGAGRPVIRGLGGDRIRILENGIGSQDVSNTSPDHAVTVDPLLAERIEVIRGPATLMYGTSAVGGVVNVIDERIPEIMPRAPAEGKLAVQGGTVDNFRNSAFSISAPAGPFAVHLDAFASKTDDVEIPGYARTEALRNNGSELEFPEPKGKLPFSSTESQGVGLGTSYIWDKGFFGVAGSLFNTNYGVPNGEENITIDGRRPRIDIRGKVSDPISFIKSMDLKLGLVDYQHTEFEGAEAELVGEIQSSYASPHAVGGEYPFARPHRAAAIAHYEAYLKAKEGYPETKYIKEARHHLDELTGKAEQPAEDSDSP